MPVYACVCKAWPVPVSYYQVISQADLVTVLIGRNSLPLEFWRVLHVEYGIVVYPSTFTEDIDVQGLGTDVTFTEAYYGHIGEFKSSSYRGRGLTSSNSHVWPLRRHEAPSAMSL